MIHLQTTGDLAFKSPDLPLLLSPLSACLSLFSVSITTAITPQGCVFCKAKGCSTYNSEGLRTWSLHLLASGKDLMAGGIEGHVVQAMVLNDEWDLDRRGEVPGFLINFIMGISPMSSTRIHSAQGACCTRLHLDNATADQTFNT